MDAAQPDTNIMSTYASKQLHVANIEPFARIQKERGLHCICSAQSKLKQVGSNKRFWIPEIDIYIKHAATTYFKRWY